MPNPSKAMGIDFDLRYSCDPKPSAIKFTERNIKSYHHFGMLAVVGQGGGFCHRHMQDCYIEGEAKADMFVCGFPCAPYSQQRASKAKLRPE